MYKKNKHSLTYLLNPSTSCTGSNNDVMQFQSLSPIQNVINTKYGGLKYNIDKVDNKLRKRLLKNRVTAQRSREKKQLSLNSLCDEIESLKAQIETMKNLLVQHNIPH